MCFSKADRNVYEHAQLRTCSTSFHIERINDNVKTCSPLILRERFPMEKYQVICDPSHSVSYTDKPAPLHKSMSRSTSLSTVGTMHMHMHMIGVYHQPC